MPHVHEYIFEHFDPWGEFETSTSIPMEIYIIATRARRILKGRSHDSLQYGVESLVWMMAGEPLDFGLDRLRKNPESGHFDDVDDIDADRVYPADHNSFLCDVTPVRGLTVTDVESVRHFIDYYDLSNQPEFPDATQSDYFALLALAIVGSVVTRDPKRHTDQYPNCGKGLLHLLCADLIVAMEAICHAEHLIELAKAQRDGKQEFSRKGGKARTAKFNSLRTECKDMCDMLYAGRGISAKLAAKRIYKSLSDTSKQIFNTSDEGQQIETIEKWVRQTPEYRSYRPAIKSQ